MNKEESRQRTVRKGGDRCPLDATLLGSCIAITVLFLAGCAPDLGAMPQPGHPEDFQTARSFVAPASVWPSDQWWKTYNDPQLDQLIDEALRDSPDLKLAEARVRSADAMSDVQGADLWPTISGDGSGQESEQSQNQGFPPQYRAMMPRGWHHAAQLKAGLQYELDFFGKNRAGLEAALSEAEAAKADSAEAHLQLSTAVASAYANLMQLFDDQQIMIEAIRIRGESARVVRTRWKAGMENQSSLSQAQSQLKSTKVEARGIARSIAVTRNQIATLLGKGPDRALTITAAPHEVKSAGLPAKLAVDLIGRRPDIVAARRIAEAAAARIKVANANFYPNVDLTGFFGLQTLDIKYLIQSSSEMGAFGPAIHLPIFDYGRNTGIYRGARAEYEGAVAQYDKTLANALREVADAYANRRALDDEIVDARGSLKDSENAYRVAKVRYEGGFARYLDLLTAENMLLQQRRVAADLEEQAFAADVTMVRSLGGGFVDKR